MFAWFFAAAAPRLSRAAWRRWPGSWIVAVGLFAALCSASAQAAPAAVQRLESALSINAGTAVFPAGQAGRVVALPDDWALSRPRYQGSVWYRTSFDLAPGTLPDELLAIYIERVCSNAEVWLNGRRIFSGGQMTEPITRNCHYPQLVTLPAALLRPQGNVIDLKVAGQPVERVASRQRAGGISALVIGPQSVLAATHADRLFWSVGSVQIASGVLAVLGCVMVSLGWLNRRDAYLGFFGWLSLGWAAMSMRTWLRNTPWASEVTEFLFTSGFAFIAALAVMFLLSYAGLRSRRGEMALAVQWVVVPASLILLGPAHLFAASTAWYAIFGAEVAAAMLFYLATTWRRKHPDFWPMTMMLSCVVALVALEFGMHFSLLGLPRVQFMQFCVTLLFIGIGARLLQVFARALQAAEVGRTNLEGRVQEITAEIERNFAQLAELRVEQVTEKERKRIAGDLHDDLGAKLLTIIHTSDSERISTLAREALEEMRLSVRGLTGKPMRLADALADWRAETVLRLGQANIEADWRSPPDEIEHLLPARGFVQTTRILREAVSNIIKHSGASHCKVRCAISDRQFGLTVQDNGKGIPLELDGRLDRGHGMSSMKHRAKQMQGQCLVESGPGYGTVIRLTLPL